MATLDLKHKRMNGSGGGTLGSRSGVRPDPHTPVPFADVEDDHNLTAVDPNTDPDSVARLLAGGGRDGSGTPVLRASYNPSYAADSFNRSSPMPSYSTKPRYPNDQSSPPRTGAATGPAIPGSPYSQGSTPGGRLPTREDHVYIHYGDGNATAAGNLLPADIEWGPYVMTSQGPDGKTWTRSYTSPDGTVVTEYKTEKSDGVIETRIEKRLVVSGEFADIDHDKALSEAIRKVTDMNPDLAVEKIEIQTTTQ